MFVRPLDHSFYIFVVCFYVLFCFHDEKGTPSTPYIFCLAALITAKLVESIVYISIERFRVLGSLHCLYIIFWSMSCFAFCVQFCSPMLCRVFFLLHYLWLVSCLFYHFLFVIYIFINDSAYFVSFCRGSITQKRAPRASIVPASANVHANKCVVSTT
jgi:hypothetical protein